MTGWRRTAFRRAVVLCAVVMLHGAVMMFFASSLQTVIPSPKEDALQMVVITAQLLAPAEPAQALPEVKAPAAAPAAPAAPAPAPPPAAVAQALPKAESRAVPEQLPAEVAKALPEIKPVAAPEPLPAEVAKALPEQPPQAVPGPREKPPPELAESAATPSSPSSASSRFRLHYHLAAKDGLVVRHGESTLTFDGDADQYVADFAWTLGDEKGGVRSEGKLQTTLSPSVYSETNQSPRPMPGLVQDSVSMIWMLQQVLQQREGKSPLENSPSSGNFSMLLGNEVTPYRWEILQTDELLLPGGAFKGVLLKSDSAVPGAPIFSVWFTPTRPYVPVRIMRTDSSGKVTDNLLKENLSELVKAT